MAGGRLTGEVAEESLALDAGDLLLVLAAPQLHLAHELPLHGNLLFQLQQPGIAPPHKRTNEKRASVRPA